MSNKSFSYQQLNGKIRAVYGTQEAFGNAMGFSRTAVNQRLNGAVEWKSSEIVRACELLSIPIDEAYIYFFM